MTTKFALFRIAALLMAGVIADSFWGRVLRWSGAMAKSLGAQNLILL
jgi:hypothetical protein